MNLINNLDLKFFLIFNKGESTGPKLQDYLKTKERTNNLFKAINENKIDILIGTQMISKGFNFPKLNCIVVIDADFSGRGYDLRTTEKNIQLYNFNA